jgi:hypothetical protein
MGHLPGCALPSFTNPRQKLIRCLTQLASLLKESNAQADRGNEGKRQGRQYMIQTQRDATRYKKNIEGQREGIHGGQT